MCTASRHGTKSARTRNGCICPEAIRDRKRYDLDIINGLPRTVDATGTRRRIQALLAIGWTGQQIMAELGWKPGTNLGAQFYQQARVHRRTADRVAEVYRRLSDTPGPSSRTRRKALDRGYLPPIYWDDDLIDDPDHDPRRDQTDNGVEDPVVIDRLVNGQPATPTKRERLAAVAVLHKRHLSYTDIAQRVGVTDRQVHRDLQELGLTARTHQTSEEDAA